MTHGVFCMPRMPCGSGARTRGRVAAGVGVDGAAAAPVANRERSGFTVTPVCTFCSPSSTEAGMSAKDTSGSGRAMVPWCFASVPNYARAKRRRNEWVTKGALAGRRAGGQARGRTKRDRLPPSSTRSGN